MMQFGIGAIVATAFNEIVKPGIIIGKESGLWIVYFPHLLRAYACAESWLELWCEP